MNEDETTQALSDKVIDRANVLRFGSPNVITTRSKSNMPASNALVSSRLSFKNMGTMVHAKRTRN